MTINVDDEGDGWEKFGYTYDRPLQNNGNAMGNGTSNINTLLQTNDVLVLPNGSNNNSNKVHYSEMVLLCTELTRTIQNDQDEMVKLYAHMKEALDVYRNGGRVFYSFTTDGAENFKTTQQLTAVTVPSVHASTTKRKKSSREF